MSRIYMLPLVLREKIQTLGLPPFIPTELCKVKNKPKVGVHISLQVDVPDRG